MKRNWSSKNSHISSQILFFFSNYRELQKSFLHMPNTYIKKWHKQVLCRTFSITWGIFKLHKVSETGSVCHQARACTHVEGRTTTQFGSLDGANVNHCPPLNRLEQNPSLPHHAYTVSEIPCILTICQASA
jgi:hypothetical protein